MWYAEDTFLFTLTNNDGTEPAQYHIENCDNAVYHIPNYGPTFGDGHDFYISDNYLNNNDSYCSLNNS